MPKLNIGVKMKINKKSVSTFLPIKENQLNLVKILQIIVSLLFLSSEAYAYTCDTKIDSSYTLLIIPKEGNRNQKVPPISTNHMGAFLGSHSFEFPIRKEGAAGLSDITSKYHRSIGFENHTDKTVDFQLGHQYRFAILEEDTKEYILKIQSLASGKNYVLVCYGAPCQVATFLTNSLVQQAQEIFLEKDNEIVTVRNCKREVAPVKDKEPPKVNFDEIPLTDDI